MCVVCTQCTSTYRVLHTVEFGFCALHTCQLCIVCVPLLYMRFILSLSSLPPSSSAHIFISFRSFFLCLYPSFLRFVNAIVVVVVVIIVVGIVFSSFTHDICCSHCDCQPLWLNASCDWCRCCSCRCCCCCSRETKTCWTKSSKKFPLIRICCAHWVIGMQSFSLAQQRYLVCLHTFLKYCVLDRALFSLTFHFTFLHNSVYVH